MKRRILVTPEMQELYDQAWWAERRRQPPGREDNAACDRVALQAVMDHLDEFTDASCER